MRERAQSSAEERRGKVQRKGPSRGAGGRLGRASRVEVGSTWGAPQRGLRGGSIASLTPPPVRSRYRRRMDGGGSPQHDAGFGGKRRAREGRQRRGVRKTGADPPAGIIAILATMRMPPASPPPPEPLPCRCEGGEREMRGGTVREHDRPEIPGHAEAPPARERERSAAPPHAREHSAEESETMGSPFGGRRGSAAKLRERGEEAWRGGRVWSARAPRV